MKPRWNHRVGWCLTLACAGLLAPGPLVASPPANCPDNVPNLGEACTAGLGACEATGVVACTDLGIGTVRVKDIRPGPEGSDPEHLTNVGGVVFFYADDGTHGRELWKSDGTEEGTVLVKDINPGPDGSPPDDPIDHLRNVGGTLLFYADDGVNGAELWRSDGTETGTVMVKDINPGPNGSRHGPVEQGGGAFVVFNGELLFWADDGVIGSELWRSDGTETGTVMVKDINPGPSGSLWPEFASLVIDDVLFFGANDGTHGYELWRSDGTTDGTVLVKDIEPGSQSSLVDADFWANLDGNLLFGAIDSSEVAPELWMSDGTEEGTVLVKDIDPRPTQGSYPADLVLAGDSVFFRGWAPDAGSELLKSDGTEEGTMLVRDINPGPFDSYPDGLTDVLGNVFFRGFRDDVGQELWKSDGTYQGTVLVKDINPGPEVSYPFFLTPLNDALFFRASDGTGGGTLWRTDGTEQGTVLLHPTVWAEEMVAANGTLFFRGYEVEWDRELWISDGTSDGSRCDAVLGEPTPEVCGDFVDNDCDGSVDEGDALDALAWFMDTDGDTFGDPARPTTACGPLPGFVADATDCDDTDDQVWALPGETGNLRFSSDKIGLSWDAPTTPGGTSVVYDTLRSENPADFESIVTCIEQDDGSDTSAVDAGSPPAGTVYHYLVGAENGCGRGSVGVDSADAERSAGACP